MRFAFTSHACGLFVAACILYSRDWSTLCSSPCDARKVGLRLSLAGKRSTNANSNATLLKDSSKGAQTGQAPGLQDLSLQAEVEWDFLGLMGSCQSEGDPAICGWCNSTEPNRLGGQKALLQTGWGIWHARQCSKEGSSRFQHHHIRRGWIYDTREWV